MSDTVKLRVGLTSARELEFEVGDATKVAADIEEAIREGNTIVWVEDSRGHRYGMVAAKLAFIEIEAAQARSGVGFSVQREGASE